MFVYQAWRAAEVGFKSSGISLNGASGLGVLVTFSTPQQQLWGGIPLPTRDSAGTVTGIPLWFVGWAERRASRACAAAESAVRARSGSRDATDPYSTELCIVRLITLTYTLSSS